LDWTKKDKETCPKTENKILSFLKFLKVYFSLFDEKISSLFASYFIFS
jgi:hypothetical protein